MVFCPKCGALLRLKEKAGKKVLWCTCGFASELVKDKTKFVKESVAQKKEALPVKETRRLEVVEEIEINPKIAALCEKCGHKEAYYWTQQTRGADEPETRFFKCVKCSHTWREYA